MIRLSAGLAAARAVGGLARATGRGGGTSLPGKVLTRMEPHAIERLASRLERGSVVISATNGKTTTAAMVSTVLEGMGARLVHNRAGANMVGGVASALAAAARRGGRSVDGDLGLFEVDEFWLAPVVEELEPRAILLSNLFRDQLDRYGELDTIADRWAELVARRAGRSQLVLNADDPLVADLGRGGDALYFGVEDPSLALPGAPARQRLQALPPLRARLRLRRRLPRPPRQVPLPQLRPDAARAPGGRPRRRAARDPQRLVHADHPGRRAPRRAAAARALQRLQRARRRGAVPDAAGAREGDRELARPRRARVRPRRDDRPRRAPDLDPARQEPRGGQRGPAHAHAGGRAARRLRGAQRPHGRRPRRLVGVGRRLGGAGAARAADDLLGHPRRRAGAAHEVRRRRRGAPARRREPRGGARRRRWPTARARCTPSPPTPRCWSCASCSPAAARPRSTGDERLRQGRLARRGVRRLHRRPEPVGQARPRRGRPGARRRRRDRPRRAAPGGRRARRHRAGPRRRAAGGAGEPRGRRRRRRSRPCSRTPPTSPSPAASR